MPDSISQAESSLLALFRKDGAIALRRGKEGLLALPSVEIAANSRWAQALTEGLRHEHGLDAVYLWNLPPFDDGATQLHMAELQGSAQLPQDWHWADVAAPGTSELSIPHMLAANRAHQVVSTYSSSYPYAQLGWFDQLVEWTSDLLQRSRRQLTGNWSQVNGGRAFLARFETANSGVWFKAPGGASQLEWNVSLRLAEVAPEWLPEVYGTHLGWKGWLSEEVGQSLYQTVELQRFDLAAEALGKLQRCFQDRSGWLFSVGVRDQRLPFLRTRIKPFLEMIGALMEIQAKERPLTLTETHVCHLGEQMDRAVEALENLNFPDSIIHGDISPGSIVNDGRRCAFIDWSRVYVGFPPVCCELMLNKFAPRLSGRDGWRELLWNTYLDQWPEYAAAFRSEHIRRSLALVSLLSYTFTKIDIDHWQNAPLKHVGSYLRGIARRMSAIVEEMKQVRVEVYQHV
jgi:hypothetical protein